MASSVAPAPNSPSPLRSSLLAAGAVVAVCAGVAQLDRLFRGGLNAPLDFAEYWTAGALNAGGRDPYSGANVRAVQRGLGLDDTAIMMWNPPWVLTLVMPLGLLPFRIAYGVWVLLHLALVVVSAELLWRTFGGPARARPVAYAVALTFAPTVFLIGAGQITAVALFGLAGYLYYSRAGRPLTAGACAALTAVKPHLLVLFALGLLLAARRVQGRKVLLGGVLVGALACVPPTLANPDVWAQYRAAVAGPSTPDHNHVSVWAPPIAGWWLRQAVPGHPFAVQWAPLVAAVGAFTVWRWRTRGAGAERAEYLPWVVGLSLLAAPYGAWAFDLVLLLVPVLAVAARLAATPNRRAVVVGTGWLVCANAAALAMMLNHVPAQWYVWFAPFVMLGAVAVGRLIPPARGHSFTASPAGRDEMAVSPSGQ